MCKVYDKNTYRVKVLSVYDGDTFTGEVDLGFHVKIVQKFRLKGLDTPEIRGEEREEGLKAKEFVNEQLGSANEVLVSTRKTGKYGRYIATVFFDGMNLNDLLITKGFAERVEY